MTAAGWTTDPYGVGRALKPRLRRGEHVRREQGVPGGHLDATYVLVALDETVCVVHAHRGPDGSGEPVHGDQGEDLVLGEARLDVAVAVAPRAQLFHDPGGQSAG